MKEILFALLLSFFVLPGFFVFAQSEQPKVSLEQVGSSAGFNIFPVLFTLFFILIIALAIFWVVMLIDCISRDFKDKLVWVLLILFLGYLGAALYYFMVKRKNIADSTSSSLTGRTKAIIISAVIIGILSVPALLFFISFSSLDSAREKARDARRQADIRQIQLGLENYRFEHGNYPLSLSELSAKYLETVPSDPETNLPYQYSRQGDSDYQVCAQLETKTQQCVSSQF